jgi:hypothetical protein
VPLLVHITNEDETESVRRSGIKVGKYRDGVYAMPVLPNFIVSNQWLRELKRGVSGSRTLSAIHFRIPDTETVYMGHYSQEHVELTAAEAAGAIMHAEDPMGMEIIIPRGIGPKEIHKIRTVPQVVGWRYHPNVRASNFCGCPACLPAGTYKSRIFRERFYDKD